MSDSLLYLILYAQWFIARTKWQWANMQHIYFIIYMFFSTLIYENVFIKKYLLSKNMESVVFLLIEA